MKRVAYEKPDAARVRSAVEGSRFGLQARAGGSILAEDKGKTASATGITYTGGVLKHWAGDVVLDLQGMDALPERGIPMLYGHFAPLGVWRSAQVTERGLEMTGDVIRAMPSAASVLAGAEAEFPWQMSVGADPIGPVSFYEKGESATVNGREFAGPVTVFDRWRLAEASIVELGLDNQTEAAVAAARGDGAPRQFLSPPKQDTNMAAVETAQTTAPPKTVEELRALAPQVAAQLEASAVKAAREQEQARVASLMELAPENSGPKVRGLVHEAIKAGKTVAEVAAAVVKAAHEESTSIVETRTVKTKAKSEDVKEDEQSPEDAAEDKDEEEMDADGEADTEAETKAEAVAARKARATLSASAESVEEVSSDDAYSDADGTVLVGSPRRGRPENPMIAKFRASWQKLPQRERAKFADAESYIGQRMLAARGYLENDGRKKEGN